MSKNTISRPEHKTNVATRLYIDDRWLQIKLQLYIE